jgi:hypothetical protein
MGSLWGQDVGRCPPYPAEESHAIRAWHAMRGGGVLIDPLGCHRCFSDLSPLLHVLGHTRCGGGRRCLCTWASSGWQEDALPQERKAGTPIALAFEQLETIDMPFDGAVAPGQREARFDGREILLEALSKAGERLNPARYGLGHPCLQGGAPAPPYERQKRR